MKNPIQEMIKEADSIEWDCIYSSKSHFNSAMLWNALHYTLGGASVLCAAVAGKQLFGDDGGLAAVLAFLAAGLTGFLTFLKPIDKAAPHHTAGTEFAALRREARMFQNIEVFSEDRLEAKLSRLKEMAERVKSLNKSSPAIPFIAYQITRFGVRRREATYNEVGESK